MKNLLYIIWIWMLPGLCLAQDDIFDDLPRPIHYFPLDSGKTAYDQITGLNGTVTGTISPYRDRYGRSGGAMKFASNNANILVAPTPDMADKQSLTYSFWLYVDAALPYPDGSNPLMGGDTTAYQVFNWEHAQRSVKVEGMSRVKGILGLNRYVKNASGNPVSFYTWLYKPIAFDQAGWYHIVMTTDRHKTTTYMFKPYGEMEMAFDFLGMQAEYKNGVSRLYLGNHGGTAPVPVMDDFCMYGEALSEEDVIRLHSRESFLVCLPLEIRSKSNNLYMDHSSPYIIQNYGHSVSGQHWFLQFSNLAYPVRFVNRNSSITYMADDGSRRLMEGSPYVVTNPKDWQIIHAGTDGNGDNYYRISTLVFDTKNYFDTNGKTSVNSNWLVEPYNTAQDRQLFYLEKYDIYKTPVSITCRNSGKMLDSRGPDESNLIGQYRPGVNNNLLWLTHKTSSGDYMVQNVTSGYYLDDKASGVSGNIGQYHKLPSTNLVWTFRKQTDGSYTIRSVGNNLFIDNGGSQDDGHNMIQSYGSQSDQIRWDIKKGPPMPPLDRGYYRLVTTNGKAPDDAAYIEEIVGVERSPTADPVSDLRTLRDKWNPLNDQNFNWDIIPKGDGTYSLQVMGRDNHMFGYLANTGESYPFISANTNPDASTARWFMTPTLDNGLVTYNLMNYYSHYSISQGYQMGGNPDNTYQFRYYLRNVTSPPTPPKSNTTFLIRCAYSYKYMDNGGQAQVNIGQYHFTPGEYENHMEWQLIYKGTDVEKGDYYQIKSVNSNLYATMSDTDETRLYQDVESGGDNQNWFIIWNGRYSKEGNPFYTIARRNQDSMFYLDNSGSTADGAPIQGNNYTGSYCQLWTFELPE